jgi:M6 family metalloprotease-like protein
MPKTLFAIFGLLCLALLGISQSAAAVMDETLGLVSDTAKGDQRYLVIVVDFPDVKPRFSLDQIRARAVEKPTRWYKAASHGQTNLIGSICGPFTLPDPIADYRVSPYNYQVDSKRVYKLVSHALSLAEENGVPIADQDLVAVIHRAHTMPGKGYGMICYCANPGMISKVKNGRARYVEIKTRRGTIYQKGVVVMAENFHVGFIVHDLAHALGGVHKGTRLAVDLYEFDLQSKPRKKFQIHDAAIHMGPWDLMSQHFIEQGKPSPGFSLFTMIRMGYVRPDQVKVCRPGGTSLARLSPLSVGGRTLGMKIVRSPSEHWLVENRQLLKTDRALPGSGVMIYKVHPDQEEGSGLVKAMNADPSAFNFHRAPYGVDGQAADMFVSESAGLAVVPLAKLGKDYLVLTTTPQKAPAARRIAQGLKKLHGTQQFKPRVKQVVKLIRQGDLAAAASAASR